MDLFLAATIAVISPLILALVTGYQARKSRTEDYERQDLVAKRTEEVAVEALRQQEQVAAKAREAADLLVKRQDAAADRAAEVQQQLLATNEKVAERTAAAAERAAAAAAIIGGKLDVIHTLVNSDMTVALEDQLQANIAYLKVLREIVALQREAGLPPAHEALSAIDTAVQKVALLQANVHERREQTKVAEAQIKQGKSGGLKAEWEATEKASTSRVSAESLVEMNEEGELTAKWTEGESPEEDAE